MGKDTLEDVLVVCSQEGNLAPLATSLGYDDFIPGDARSFDRVVCLLARELLKCCVLMQKAGVAHRDVKPLNMLCLGGRIMMIDFGSAAAMGIQGRVGYDWDLSPCDPRYVVCSAGVVCALVSVGA